MLYLEAKSLEEWESIKATLVDSFNQMHITLHESFDGKFLFDIPESTNSISLVNCKIHNKSTNNVYVHVR